MNSYADGIANYNNNNFRAMQNQSPFTERNMNPMMQSMSRQTMNNMFMNDQMSNGLSTGMNPLAQSIQFNN